MKWVLVKHEGTIEDAQWELPGHLLEHQVEEIVKRLVCRTLTEDEIINSSLPEDDAARYILLDRNEDAAIINIGRNPFYIARQVAE